MKRFVSALLVVVLFAALLEGSIQAERANVRKKEALPELKVGVILNGDETESYTKAHIHGIQAAAKKLGISENNIEWKTRIDGSDVCYDAAKSLAEDGCSLIIANSRVHQDYIKKAAEKFPDVNFVCIGGDYAAISQIDNFYNGYTAIYEARYVSGVVAGMKLEEMLKKNQIPEGSVDEEGRVRIGYVGSYPDAQTVSDYTAFYLGIKSIVSNVVMNVAYTHTDYDMELETTAADTLMNLGCVIIGQHDGSTGVPAAIQARKDAGQIVYYVGCNADMSETAPTASLTSAVSNWKTYYLELFKKALHKEELPQDWCGGYAENAVKITQLGSETADGTETKVEELEAAISDGTCKVFDTSTFTVSGGVVSDAKVDLSLLNEENGEVVYPGETVEAIASEDGSTYFAESKYRSAPYFTLRIDGITELNAEETAEE